MQGLLGLPGGGEGGLDTSGPVSQLKVLERSLGPRPLLSGIETRGVRGRPVCVPKLLGLVSVLLSPEKPWEDRVCTDHPGRAWAARERGEGRAPGLGDTPKSEKPPEPRFLSYGVLCLSVGEPLAAVAWALSLAVGFLCAQLRSRMGQLPWKCSP